MSDAPMSDSSEHAAIRVGSPTSGGSQTLPPVERMHIRFEHDSNALSFANEIKTIAVKRLLGREKYSSILLSAVDVSISAFMHPELLGLASSRGTIKVTAGRESDGALGLAATMLHECAHIIVGPKQSHNENWIDACHALGLREATAVAPPITLPEHFDPDVLAAICEAIERWARANPTLIYDPDAPIPWPTGVGLWSCPEPHTSYHPCAKHWAHVLEYQDVGIRDMLQRKRGILLADEMGVGKTVEVMGFINATAPKSILIVAPNNAKLVWKSHFQRWCVHEYELEVAQARFYMFSDVVICSYEAALKLADVLKKRIWDLVIFDEGHYLKNPSAKRSRACFSFQGKKQIIVTGSPIVNYVIEVFPLAHYLDIENFREASRFEAKFGGRGQYKFGYNLGHLNAFLRSTIMIRRLKKDVLKELPVKRRQIVQFEVPDEVRPLIEEELDLWRQSQNNLDASTLQFINAMKNESDEVMTDEAWGNLIMELANSKRYAFEKMAKIAHNIALAKLPLVYEEIESIIESKEKVVVFGHHRDVMEKLCAHFKELNPVLVYGGQDESENAEKARRFSTDDSCRMFVGGIKVAQGWSLKGSSIVLFIEEDWVPGMMLQAEDRVHGIGRGDSTAGSTQIKHLVFEDSLDTHKAQYTIKKLRSIDKATGRL